jgi:hypothetical protein
MIMKKIVLMQLLVACLALGTSCLTSLQPLVTPDNIITENKITGVWQYKDQVVRIQPLAKSDMFENISYSVSGNMSHISSGRDEDSVFNSKLYSLSFEKKGVTYNMLGGLTRIKHALFIDLSPATIKEPAYPEDGGFIFNMNYLNSSTIARVEIGNNNALLFRFLNGDYIKEQILHDRMRIRHEKDDLSGTILITASSAELQQFIEKYGQDERLFSKENSVTLTRKE